MPETAVLDASTEAKAEPKPTKKKRAKKKKRRSAGGAPKTQTLAFPKHSILECLRIPQAILEQNAGKECTDREGAGFAGLKYYGALGVEISSGIKYGLLERPAPGTIKPTDITRRIVRPQKPNDKVDAMREAVLHAPLLSDLYKHYRGENLPDTPFLINTARDTYHVPQDKVDLFVQVFQKTLQEAKLLEESGGKRRVLDVTHAPDVEGSNTIPEEQLKKVSRGVAVQAGDTCFVMMPFALPLGGYYASIYEPAIKKAGITPIRADADMFGTGKIIDQIWSGINNARVLVAELTGRNPNVLYELGLAHALKKPVVLISSNEADVPFDVRHVRVIYYEMTDPFWGEKLISKVAENVVSALKNPKEAILFEAPKAQ